MADYDHWLRFNVGDYVADTLHLTALQHGVYLLLILHYFKHRGLPEDERGLAQIARLRIDHWRRASPAVMALFQRKTITDGHIHVTAWAHKRIDAELERASNGKEKSAFPNGKFSVQGHRYDSESPVKQSRSDRGSSTQARARASPTPRATETPPLPPRKRGGGERDGAKMDGFAGMVVDIRERRG